MKELRECPSCGDPLLVARHYKCNGCGLTIAPAVYQKAEPVKGGGPVSLSEKEWELILLAVDAGGGPAGAQRKWGITQPQSRALFRRLRKTLGLLEEKPVPIPLWKSDRKAILCKARAGRIPFDEAETLIKNLEENDAISDTAVKK